jgi:hypothetical protein
MAEDRKGILTPPNKAIGIDAPLEILEVPRNMTFVVVIELIGANSFLAIEELQMPFDDENDGLD